MEAVQAKTVDPVEEEKVEGYAFVYGTLKVGGKFAPGFDADRLEVMPCSIKGTLYNTGWFPALVLDGDNEIQGEIHRYKNWNLVKRRMDRIECYNRKDPKNSLFVRHETEMETPNGAKVTVIFYEYNHERGGIPKDFKEVESGFWEV